MRKRCLTDLPENILFDIFDHLDDVSLCEVAQLCPTFWRLGGTQCAQLSACLVTLARLIIEMTCVCSIFQAIRSSGCTWIRVSCQVWMLSSGLEHCTF